MKAINISQTKVCRPSNIIDGRCTVKDDSQTLNLRGWMDFGIVSDWRETMPFSQSGFSAYEENLSFITVKFEEVV